MVLDNAGNRIRIQFKFTARMNSKIAHRGRDGAEGGQREEELA